MSQSPVGLRELKKQLTRDSIADVTLQLTLEQGLEHVTINDIARVAFVSPRTVSNYFSGKEEAIAAAGRNLSDTIIDDLARRPADEPALESMHRVTIDFIHSLTPDQLEAQRHKRRLGNRYPGINAYLTARYDLVEELTRPVLAVRTGTDIDTDIYPWLLAASAVAAVRVAVMRWAVSEADRDELTSMLDGAFARLKDGLETTT
jgi:AcrR family transcriptional regulator